MGRPIGVQSAARLPRLEGGAPAGGAGGARRPAIAATTSSICEGAGSPAEINLLDRDIVNLPLADAAGLPAIVVGDIDRGGVFAALHGTVELLPHHLRKLVRGFVINRLRGDPALLGDACADLERRCGVPTLGVIPTSSAPTSTPRTPSASTGLRRATRCPARASTCSTARRGGDPVAAGVEHRRPRSPAAGTPGRGPLGAVAGRSGPARPARAARVEGHPRRPGLVPINGTCRRRDTRRRRQHRRLGGVCRRADAGRAGSTTPAASKAPPAATTGLGLAAPGRRGSMATRCWIGPRGWRLAGPGAGQRVSGYRIHHGRVGPHGAAAAWLVADGGDVLGWHAGGVCGTTLHGLLEDDGFRASMLRWVADRSGKRWRPGFRTIHGGAVRAVRSHRRRHRGARRPRSSRRPHRGGRDGTSLSTTPSPPAK